MGDQVLVYKNVLAKKSYGSVGCGWAFQSAEWLAETAGNSLQSPEKLDRGLAAYGRRHRFEFAGHELWRFARHGTSVQIAANSRL